MTKKQYATVHFSDLFDTLEGAAKRAAGSSSHLKYRIFELGQEYEIENPEPIVKPISTMKEEGTK